MARQPGGGLFSEQAPEPEPDETGLNTDALEIVNRQRLAGEAAREREEAALRENAGRMEELRKHGINVETAQPMPMGPAPTYGDVPGADDPDALKKYGEQQLQDAEARGRAGVEALGFDSSLLRRAQPGDPGLGAAGPADSSWWKRTMDATNRRLSGVPEDHGYLPHLNDRGQPATEPFTVAPKLVDVGDGVRIPVYGWPDEPESLHYATTSYRLVMSIEYRGRHDEQKLAGVINRLGKIQMGRLSLAATMGFGPGDGLGPKRASFSLSVVSDSIVVLHELLKAGEEVTMAFPRVKITSFALTGAA